MNGSQLNERFKRLTRFEELFVIGNYFVQPHIVHINTQLKGEDNPWHKHPTLEFSLLLSGEMTYRTDDLELPMKQGDVVMLPPELRHCREVVSEECTTFGFMLYVSCQGTGARRRLRQLYESMRRHNYCVQAFTRVEDLIRKIIDVMDKWDSYTDEQVFCLSRETYVELFRHIIPVKSVPTTSRLELRLRGDDPNRIVEEIIYYIQDNAYRPLRPAEISRYIGKSINELNRLLKTQGRPSLGQHIVNQKLLLACSLLDNSNRLVKDIALSLGFENADYFCRMFRKYKGMSPSEYRMKSRNQC